VWVLGWGGWGLGVGPNPPNPKPQSPIPNPQSPTRAIFKNLNKIFNIITISYKIKQTIHLN
jgi:hypothetical protein